MFQALDSYAQDIVEFARVHEVWATPIAFMLAFGESLAFVSLFIPAWAALVGLGALIEAGELRFWPIWVGGALGAAIGDWVSYKYWSTCRRNVASVAIPCSFAKRYIICTALGCGRYLYRPLLRAAASVGAACC
jgi:hypothetical protein